MNRPTVKEILDAIELSATYGERNAKTLHPCPACGSMKHYRIDPRFFVWLDDTCIAGLDHGEPYMQCVDCGHASEVTT
jgi:ribosomal protein L37AE/L43A